SDGVRAVVPGAWRAAAHADLGAHAGGRARLPDGGRVDRDLPRPGDLADRAGDQLSWGRPAGSAGPAAEAANLAACRGGERAARARIHSGSGVPPEPGSSFFPWEFQLTPTKRTERTSPWSPPH